MPSADAVYYKVAQQNKSFEIDRNELHFGKQLGTGNFGEVLMAQYRGLPVAVKRLHNMNAKELRDFEHEGAVMKRLPPHPNVIQLVGLVSDPPPMIVVEFASGGALDAFLQANFRTCADVLLAAFVSGAARGLAHLHANGVVHRDVAARNLLISSTGALKIADFGMSREDHGASNQTKTTMGPIRWMAVEQLFQLRYSPASDLWAFGVLVWEIYSGGVRPYDDLTNAQVALAVSSGRRLMRPHRCPPRLWSAVAMCFDANPDARPPLAHIESIASSDVERLSSRQSQY